MLHETKQKSIHYKRAVLTNSSMTLQSLLENVLTEGGILEKVESRQENLNPNIENGGFRFLNKSSKYQSIFFGQLIAFERGRSQALLSMNGDVPFYDIKSITTREISASLETNDSPLSTEEIKREFIDSFLYFGVFGNHLVMMQSSSLRSRDLEGHLNWLLTSCGLLDKNTAIILQDKPTEEAVRQLQNAPVKSIKLGSPIKGKTEVLENKATTVTDITQVKKVKFMPKGRGGDIIAAVMGHDWVEQLDLEDTLDEANLQVNLEITYLRKTTKRGQQVIDSIATSLRHLEDEDVTIDLKGGGTINGSALKLSGLISVKFINGLVDDDDLYLKMHHWLNAKISIGEIDKAD